MTTLVFVHGYSVTNLNTYGELPLRLQAEAAANGLQIDVQQIFLGRYISFHDEVTLDDISRAFDNAIKDQLKGVERFVCITHSTGGPVVRNWWNRYYSNGSTPPISHLIMLAPANFGSALAKLGKSTLSRIATFCEGVEPGQRVLNWLQLGSMEAWELNKKWIASDGKQIGPKGIYPFVITGQSIDRKLYDHLNSYTGEIGSDGVVRTAAANLNARYIKLEQDTLVDPVSGEIKVATTFTIDTEDYNESPEVPLRVVAGKSHSGDDMGVMKSVKRGIDDAKSKETVDAIFDCIKVTDDAGYKQVAEKFKAATDKVQQDELVETEKELLIITRHFVHDRYSQVIFRVSDTEGKPVTDYDLILTAGENNDPNHLPKGFATDRQQNSNNPEVVTYFFNYDVMNGTPKNSVRDAIVGTTMLGLRINPRPLEGFVRYVPCEIKANEALLEKALKPNSTTLIDIVLQRVVSKETFRMEKTDGTIIEMDFHNADWRKSGIAK